MHLGQYNRMCHQDHHSQDRYQGNRHHHNHSKLNQRHKPDHYNLQNHHQSRILANIRPYHHNQLYSQHHIHPVRYNQMGMFHKFRHRYKIHHHILGRRHQGMNSLNNPNYSYLLNQHS
jgi:hypothetical protein